MLALQAVEGVEALLDRLEPARLAVDPVEVAAQVAGHVVELDRRRAQPLGELRRARGRRRRPPPSPESASASAAPAPPPSSSSPPIAASARAAAVRAALGVSQTARARPRAPPPRSTLGAAASISESSNRIRSRSRSRAPSRSRSSASSRASAGRLRVRRAVAVAELEQLGAGEAVEDLELGRGEHQLAVLVLAVEGEQPRAERPQLRGRGRAPADEGAGPPRGADPPAEHDLVGVVGKPLGDRRQLGVVEGSGREREDALDPGLLGARADDLGTRAAAHQQVERVGEHGLSRPGLAGDRVQARLEAQLGALDQQQVLDPQLVQHAVPF